MARSRLTFDQVKATKATPAAAAPEPNSAVEPETAEKRGRGRPPKRLASDGRTFGMTLRVPGNLRKALRRLSEDETDASGHVVSIHDIILQALEAHLSRKGVKIDN